jgi:hypothetical protein
MRFLGWNFSFLLGEQHADNRTSIGHGVLKTNMANSDFLFSFVFLANSCQRKQSSSNISRLFRLNEQVHTDIRFGKLTSNLTFTVLA